MDSPAVTQLFRQLFRHRACPSRRNLVQLATAIQHVRGLQHSRSFSSRRGGGGGGGSSTPSNESNWQQRTDLFVADMAEEYKKYPMVTSTDLRARKERPRRVKMLTRDFIEGSFVRSFDLAFRVFAFLLR